MSLYGESPHGDLTYGDFDTDYAESVADALEVLLDRPQLDRSWWLRAKPRDASTSTTPPTLLDVNLSTDGHRTFPTDAEELQLHEGIVVPYHVGIRLDGLWGVGSMSFGEVVIGNPDGSRTSLADEDWVGRQADVYVGPRGGVQVQFARVGQLLSRQISWDRQTLSLQVDDYSFLFDGPVQTTSYAGTGGLEGGDDIKGRPKPILFGVVPQLEPVAVDPTNHVYQIHDGAMEAVLAAEDGKGALTFDSDVADITTATPVAGEYATSLATGYIKLGEAPAKVLTVTAKGHSGSAYGYVEEIAGLLKLLSVTFAGLSDPGELDGVAFTSLATHTAQMGHWTGLDSQSIRSVMSVFCQSAGSWAWLRPNKVLTVGRITDPDSATAEVSLDASRDDLGISPWEIQPYEIPVGRVRVGYKRYPRVLSDTEVVGSATETTRKDAGKEYRFAIAEDSSVFVQTPEADEIEILTQLYTESDAQALADEQLALRKVSRRLGRFSPRKGLIKWGLGTVVSVADDRLPTTPKKWVIIGLRNEAGINGRPDNIEWECFG